MTAERGEPTAPLNTPLTVTVIIPAHNEAESIQMAVQSCLEQTYPPESVIVVDDGSTDDTSDLARAAGAVVVNAPGGLKCRAQNLGLGYVTTDLVVSVDADTMLASDAIEHLVATIAKGYDGTCAAVRPQQNRGLFVRSRKFEYALARRWLKPIQQAVGRIHVLSGCAYCFKVEVLKAIGGIPELAIGEDTNLTWTLYGHGYKLAYTPAALCYTKEPETLKVYLAQLRRWSASCYQCIARHKRQLLHPGRALVVGTALWDMLGVWVSYLVWATVAVRHGLEWAGLFGLWGLTMQAIALFVVATEIGFKEALKCWPAHFVVSFLMRWVYVWTMIREWVLGRHFGSWTGRQGRGTVISRMRLPRKVTFASSLGLAVLLIPGTIAVLPPPVRERMLETVIPGPDPTPQVTLNTPVAPDRQEVRRVRRRFEAVEPSPIPSSNSDLLVLTAAPLASPSLSAEPDPDVKPEPEPDPEPSTNPTATEEPTAEPSDSTAQPTDTQPAPTVNPAPTTTPESTTTADPSLETTSSTGSDTLWHDSWHLTSDETSRENHQDAAK